MATLCYWMDWLDVGKPSLILGKLNHGRNSPLSALGIEKLFPDWQFHITKDRRGNLVCFRYNYIHQLATKCSKCNLKMHKCNKCAYAYCRYEQYMSARCMKMHRMNRHQIDQLVACTYGRHNMRDVQQTLLQCHRQR